MMKKRDLKADLEHCAHFGKLVEMGWYKLEAAYTVESVREILDFALAASEGWPHAIERAIKAETLARELAEALQLYENWEAKVIMDDSLWQSASGLPFITQEVWDDLVAIQRERNKVLHKAKEVLGIVRVKKHGSRLKKGGGCGEL